MSDEQQFTPEDRALFEAEVNRLRQQELPRARDEEIKAAAQRAVERDLEQEREAYREELDTAVAQTTSETLEEERAEARREGPSKLLLGILLLIVLLIVLAATGNLKIPFIGGGGNRPLFQGVTSPARWVPRRHRSAVSMLLDRSLIRLPASTRFFGNTTINTTVYVPLAFPSAP